MPEELSVGLAVVPTQIFGVVITLAMQSIAMRWDYVVASWFPAALFALAFFVLLPFKVK